MIITLHFQKANLNYSWSYPNRAHPDEGTMLETKYANTEFLIVTCYLLLHG